MGPALELSLQTTLLGLAIALILALVTALVGPLLVDWGTYRALFEKQASHIVGVDVRVTGAIDARLLPSPRLTLHDIEIGAGADTVRARALGIEFALGALMRGEWRATEMQLSGPRVMLGLDERGKVRTPNVAVAFNPDALVIDRLIIDDGEVTLADAASGASITLDRFWFNGEARSLLGPFKGEGAFALDGELFPYRVSSGRYNDDGAVKLRLNVDPVNRPLSIDVDGALVLAGNAPRFDGAVTLARPVGIAAQGTPALRGVTPPWRLSGKIKARAQSALIENIDFQYGAEELGVRLTGVADLTFGKSPLFNVVLSGRQIDLDRAMTGAGVPRAPAAALRELVEVGGRLFHPGVPIKLGLGIDQVTVGGGALQNLRGDISSGAGRWNLDRMEFRAPGFTQVRLSGGLILGDPATSFNGPVEIEAGDVKVLAAWLEGRGDTGQGDRRLLRLRGDLTLGNEKIAVERLTAEFERKTISGRLAYVFPSGSRKARLDAALNAPDLDIDAALGFGRALVAGSRLERPHDMTISTDIGRATIAGFTARDLIARVKVDGEGLQIDRLSVTDLGGATFSASGRILTGSTSPQGSLRVDLDAPDLTPVVALMSRVAPETAQILEKRAAAMAPAKVTAQFTLVNTAATTQGKLAVDGSLGAIRVALVAQGDVDPLAMAADGDIRLGGKIEAEDGRRLLAMLGVDKLVTVGSGPGVLSFDAKGPAREDMTIGARLAAAGLEASASGTARLFGDKPESMLSISIARADASPLRGARRGTLPVTYTGRVELTGDTLAFRDINATAAGATVRGRLAVKFADPYRISGEIDAESVEAGALIAATIGTPAAPDGSSWSWSSEPFAGGAIGLLTGEIALKARRVALLPHLSAREVHSTLRLGKNEIVFDDIVGALDGGTLAGRLAVQAANGSVKTQAKLVLKGADAAGVLAAGARPAVSGTLGISAEMEGAGLSPVALIGSLQGTGKITLVDGRLAGLDPRAFDAVTRAVDQGLVVDQTRIADIVSRTLASGQLSVKRGEGVLALNAGQLRLSSFNAKSDVADVSLSGILDLIDGALDARLVLSGTGEAGAVRPDIYMALKGPFTAPTRTIDVSALTGWLTLRSVESQAKKLRAVEQAATPPPAGTQTPAHLNAPALPSPVTIGPLPAPSGTLQPSIGAQN